MNPDPPPAVWSPPLLPVSHLYLSLSFLPPFSSSLPSLHPLSFFLCFAVDPEPQIPFSGALCAGLSRSRPASGLFPAPLVDPHYGP